MPKKNQVIFVEGCQTRVIFLKNVVLFFPTTVRNKKLHLRSVSNLTFHLKTSFQQTQSFFFLFSKHSKISASQILNFKKKKKISGSDVCFFSMTTGCHLLPNLTCEVHQYDFSQDESVVLYFSQFLAYTKVYE